MPSSPRRLPPTTLAVAALSLMSLALPAAPAFAAGQREPVSADARYRVYLANHLTGVKLLDRSTGTVESVSLGADGHNAMADTPDIDYSGRHVVFASYQPAVIDDTNAVSDIYVRDRSCPTSQRLSVSATGTQANGNSTVPGISGDGSTVAFVSQASNLVAGDTNRSADVFVTDRATGAIERVSVDAQSHQSTGGLGANAMVPALSADGRFVAFSTTAGLTPDDTDGGMDVYLRDRALQTTTRVSVDATINGGWAVNPSISADGRFVAFEWQTVDPGASGFLNGIWVHDMVTGRTERASTWPGGAGWAMTPSISADGTRVAFAGDPSGTAPSGNQYDSWVRDLRTGTTTAIRAAGQTASLRTPDISANGRFVSWSETSAVGGVRDLGAATERPVPAVTTFDGPCHPGAVSPYRAAVLADQPLTYWRFGEVLGARSAFREAGSSADSYVGVRTGVPGALAGDPNTAMSFDAGGASPAPQYVVADYERLFVGRAPFTLEAWIRPRDLNGHTRRVFSSEGTSAGYMVGVRDSGLYFSRYVAGHASTVHTALPAGRWTHVAASYDGQLMRLYVDGSERATTASTIALPTPGQYERPFVIGSKRTQWLFYSGDIDEAAVYARALPAARVARHDELGRGL